MEIPTRAAIKKQKTVRGEDEDKDDDDDDDDDEEEES
jgi:hypothetical protein